LASAKTDHEKTALQRQIDATDQQIDRPVYELYGLTKEKIRIVEVFTFYHPELRINQVDVFIKEPLNFDALEKELVWITARDVTIPVVSLSHLKILKRIAGRPQDFADIEALEELEKEDEG